MADTSTPQRQIVVSMFDDLVRCETRLYNALGDQLRQQHGIPAAQFEFLRQIRDHPNSRVGDLAAAFAVGVGATSKGIDKLVAQGWVLRERDLSDRRSSFLAVSASGAGVVAAAEILFDQLLAELVGLALDAPEVEMLGSMMSKLRSALQHENRGTPAG